MRLPAVLLAGALGLAGCGYVGPPLPPTLDIPMQSTDFRAAQFGDSIEVVFTVPALSTEGLKLRELRGVELRVGTLPNPFSMEAWAAGAKAYSIVAAAPGPMEHMVLAGEWIGKEVVVAARATGPKGKTSDWSNIQRLHIQPPLARPSGLGAANAENAVKLTWQGSAGRYRVFRAVGTQNPDQIGESDQAEYLDASIHLGTSYRYQVQAIAAEAQQSELSEAAPIIPADVFPPAVPAGLSAQAGVDTIELSWERNTESDFQGYNVYRSVDGGAFDKIAPLIVAPTYTDRQVQVGKKYRYQIRSVDVTGNESGPAGSGEVTAQ